MSRTPSVGSEVTGQVVRSWLMSACAQSRAVFASSASDGFEEIGLASLHKRLPRSKVYGMGLVTLTELLRY